MADTKRADAQARLALTFFAEANKRVHELWAEGRGLLADKVDRQAMCLYAVRQINFTDRALVKSIERNWAWGPRDGKQKRQLVDEILTIRDHALARLTR